MIIPLIIIGLLTLILMHMPNGKKGLEGAIIYWSTVQLKLGIWIMRTFIAIFIIWAVTQTH